ncbi:MAG TPA: alcohol dehydrogenase catalytic domain-containing protein, partial [Chloroflexota bacterium]|nr:alcohol dehydrogenase catalytic domain-containing protein [Chloroflexota bacterium]
MKAARLYGPRDLRVETIPDPRPGPGEALIHIHACGVCPSDLRSYLGSRPGGASGAGPRTPGHEWAGEIVSLGDETEGAPAEGAPPEGEPRLQVGDRVVADPRNVCGRCYQCRRGVFNYCERLQRIVRGGFAEYGVSPLSQLRRLPDHVSYEEASFCEPLACVVNGNEMT